MKNSHIEWTDHTWNPWIGCTKVDELCDHCYAETRDIRWAQGVHWGAGAPRQRTSGSNWKEPLKWNRDAQKAIEAMESELRNAFGPDSTHLDRPRRPRVFCASLSDWLDAEVPIEWLCDMLWIVDQCRNLDWLLLTKRPQLWRTRLTKCLDSLKGGELGPRGMIERWLAGDAPSHVWFGTSVGTAKSVDLRVPAAIEVPAKVRFLSCEPLLEPIVVPFAHLLGIRWIIAGGESGAGARPMDPEWALSLKLQCGVTNTAFFMKQMGGVRNKRGLLSDLPMDLQTREFPTSVQ